MGLEYIYWICLLGFYHLWLILNLKLRMGLYCLQRVLMNSSHSFVVSRSSNSGIGNFFLLGNILFLILLVNTSLQVIRFYLWCQMSLLAICVFYFLIAFSQNRIRVLSFHFLLVFYLLILLLGCGLTMGGNGKLFYWKNDLQWNIIARTLKFEILPTTY